MVRTAIQLHTLRHLEEPPWDVVERVGETTFDGVEFYDGQFDSYDDETLERTTDALDDADLDVAGIHVGAERIEEGFDDLVTACDAFDCTTLVIPTYEGEAFESGEGIEGAADRIAGLAADLAAEGIDLLYHNHTFEFGDVDGEVAFETFVDRADGRFAFQPDVGLAAHAGYDPLELLDVVDGQAPVVHLTDSDPDAPDGLHVDVGGGIVDVDACADAAAANGAEWFVCENGRSDDAAASLAHGSDAFADLRARVDGQ